MKTKALNLFVALLAVLVLCSLVVYIFANPALKFFLRIIIYFFLPIVGIYAITIPLMKGGLKTRKIVVWLLRIIILSALYVYLSNELANMLKDIPNALRGNYYEIIGIPGDIKIKNDKFRERNFTIDGIEFEVDDNSFTTFQTDARYKISYLPNSNTVISMEKY